MSDDSFVEMLRDACDSNGKLELKGLSQFVRKSKSFRFRLKKSMKSTTVRTS